MTAPIAPQGIPQPVITDIAVVSSIPLNELVNVETHAVPAVRARAVPPDTDIQIKTVLQGSHRHAHGLG
ncbi:hypothetical protein [Nitratireductor basaltis]|uniref:hypothetical protein n=1 Tax=Nitratireductor basaltis TaxID=472175 RepID=UPI000A8221B0|nr:hypothetical protein [Nitratireductor basaltis]